MIYKYRPDTKPRFCMYVYRKYLIFACLVCTERIKVVAFVVVESNDLLDKCQAGFRQGFWTQDNMFVLQHLKFNV